MIKRLRPLLLTLLVLLVAAPAVAAPPPPAPAEASPEARAAELKTKADAAMDGRHYDDAIAIYSQAYQVFPDPALLYNRSRAHEARGEYPDAYADMEKFANTASPELRARVPRLTDLLLELRNKISGFELTCNVAGARVLVGGKEVGATPLPAMKLNAGKVTVEILAEGQYPYKREVDLKGGGSASLDAVLQPRATNGILLVKSAPDGAMIDVDGKPFGRAPTEGVLGAGTHSVVANAEGYLTASTQAVVVAGASKEVQVSLSRKSSLVRSPWFWTVVGIVVVGAAVAIAAAVLIERAPDEGSGFEPGQIAAPLRW